MQICFTSDLHGRVALYDQLERLIAAETPDVLLLGGDLFPDGNGADPAASQAAYVDDVFSARIQTWTKLRPNLTIACILGNHDWLLTETHVARLRSSGALALLNGEKPLPINGVHFTGYARTPPTPHFVKDFERLDLPGDPLPQNGGSIWDVTSAAIRAVSSAEHFKRPEALAVDLQLFPMVPAPWIFVCHAPPYATKLDRLPHLDAPIGSRAVRKFIETRSPICALHGHVHESPQVTGDYHDWVGQTLCINPGQTDDRLCAVLFDAERPRETLRHTVYR